MSLARKPCPNTGCDNTIPVNWRQCKDRRCAERAFRLDHPDAELTLIIEANERERNATISRWLDGKELKRLVNQQHEELKRPWYYIYKHDRRMTGSGSIVSLDALVLNDSRTLMDLVSNQPGRVAVEWWDPTADAAIRHLEFEAFSLERETDRERCESMQFVRVKYAPNRVDPKTGFNSWDAA